MRERQTPTVTTQVSIEEFRIHLADLIGKVMYGHETVAITRYKRQAAILISAVEYERLLDPTKRLTKRQWQAQVRKLEVARRSVQEVDPDELEALVDRAVSEFRARKNPSER